MSVLRFVVLVVVFAFYGEKLILFEGKEMRETWIIFCVILEKKWV